VAPTNVKEKVWYHSNCGNKGRDGCTNRSLVERGGCTIWYDETNLLSKIEERILESITELGSDFALPESLTVQLSDYGEAVRFDATMATNKSYEHLLLLGPTVKELADMEVQAQNVFLALQSSFLPV
jgi:ATP-dependent RNA helicase DDX1